MKQKQILAGCMAVFMLLLTACGGAAKGESAVMAETPAASAPASDMAYGAMDNGYMEMSKVEGTTGENRDSSVYQNSQAKLIRRAQLTIQTTEFDQAVDALDQMVIRYNGYFETASVYGGSYRNAHANRTGEYVVRIPAEHYTSFLNSTGDLGYVVRSVKSSEDVGEKYYDTEARLKTQRIKQERLLSLLEKAESMEDIISLENALSDVEYQIEQLSSTLNRYDALIDYATFTIGLNEVTEVNEAVGEKATLWERMSAGFASSGKGLVNGFQDLMVWFSYHAFGLIVALGIAAIALFKGGRLVKKQIAARNKSREEQK